MSEQKEDLKRLYEKISDNHTKWQKLREFNRNCDEGLTVATISLTLFIALLGVEGISIDDNLRKAFIGLSGGVVVAIQSIGNAFPVKQRAGGYQLIQGQAYTQGNRI